jgi:hypothetical protein
MNDSTPGENEGRLPSEYLARLLPQMPAQWQDELRSTAGWLIHQPLDVQHALLRQMLIDMQILGVEGVSDSESAVFMLTQVESADQGVESWAGLILDPNATSPSSLSVSPLDVQSTATRFAFKDAWPFASSPANERARAGIHQLIGKDVMTANLIPTPIITAPMPVLEDTIKTGDEIIGNRNVVTLGAPVKDTKGRVGFVSAAHGFAKPPDGRGSLPDGTTGTVEVLSEEWDAAFVSCDEEISWAVPCSSVLKTEAPGRGTRGQFAGQVSGIGAAVVDAVDPILPYYGNGPWTARVYTNRITEPGDSGAVLVDGAGRAIGLAISRTKDGEPLQFSVWAWMAGVLDALDAELVAP